MSAIDDSLVNRAAPPGSMRYFSLLYTPEERRDAVLALYVIESEIRESSRSVSHDVAHTRLQWWRGETDRLVNGNPQHPATRVLFDRALGDRAVFSKLHEILVAADMDLARMTYADHRELRVYCSRSGGALQELIASQLIAPDALDETARAAANRLGVGIRQSEMLRDLRQDAYDGNIYLPLDLLDKHNLKPEHLRARDMEANLKDALRAFRSTTLAELQPLSRSPQAHRLRPVLVLAELHRKLLDRIAARNYDVASERIDLGPIQKPWVAWRAARRAK
jgi:15-cis-phytoene synthase